MQDNAPCHTAKVVKAQIKKLKISMIDWPPYSQDPQALVQIQTTVQKCPDIFFVAGMPDPPRQPLPNWRGVYIETREDISGPRG